MSAPEQPPGRTITITVNGIQRDVAIEDRELLVDVVRHKLGLTGTHVGCYNGDCGACTLSIDGRIAKSCLVLAASADGAELRTIEDGDGRLDDVQQAFWEADAFQCGFCLPGQLFAARALLAENPAPTETEVREALMGNLCRCTGYANAVAAIGDVARRRAAEGPATP
jgi:aerobic carbon-monoxide dehydrogenase small subunit